MRLHKIICIIFYTSKHPVRINKIVHIQRIQWCNKVSLVKVQIITKVKQYWYWQKINWKIIIKLNNLQPIAQRNVNVLDYNCASFKRNCHII